MERRQVGRLRTVALALATALVAMVAPVVVAGPANADGTSIANIALGELSNASTGNPENPTNSGCNKYTGALFGPSGGCPGAFGNHGSYGWAWCADFATWVWKQAGVDIGGLNSAVKSFSAYGSNHGTYHAYGSGYVPQPGDAAIYNNAHVGIVVSSGKATPDVVSGNVKVAGLWQVYRANNSTNDGGGDALTGFVTPVGGTGGGTSSGGSGPKNGQILGTSCRDFHTGPSGTSPQVDCIPNGATIGVECVKTGQSVTGPYGTENIWDRTVYNGKLGFVSDSWVYTGTNDASAPDCGGNGVMMTAPCQNLFAAPSSSSAVVACVPEAIAITVDCTATGDSVNGPFGASTLWDHTTYGGHGFVPDASVYTGTDAAIAGTCAGTPTAPTAPSQTLPSGTVGQAYSTVLSASGGTAPYTWTVQRGPLPDGLSLATNGTLSGTPTGSGTTAFGVQVVDSYGLASTATETLSVASPDTKPSTPLVSASINVGQHVDIYYTGTPGDTVGLWARTAPAAEFSQVRTAAFDGTGHVSFSVAPRFNTTVFAQTAAGQSSSSTIYVRPAESLRGSASGRLGSFSGGIVPGHAGVTVKLFTVASGRLTYVGSAVTDVNGKWTYSRTFAATGPVSFISQTVSDATSLSGQSNRVSVTFS